MKLLTLNGIKYVKVATLLDAPEVGQSRENHPCAICVFGTIEGTDGCDSINCGGEAIYLDGTPVEDCGEAYLGDENIWPPFYFKKHTDDEKR